MPKPHVRQKYQYLFSGQLKEEHTPFKLQIGLKNIRKKMRQEKLKPLACDILLSRDFYHRQMLHIPKAS